mgnify:CR=1 FL=1
MCLAIYKPAETKPDWEAYRNGHLDNADGWGFAVVENGELLDATGVGNFDEFRRNFEPFADRQAIIHFRWATHGRKDVSNCHPFVHDGLALIHNGVVNICCKSDPGRSDTYHFMQSVVIPMYERDRDFFMRNDIQYTMEMAHGSSKFVLLRADGAHAIWNESDGIQEEDGHWYSNSDYRYSRWCRGYDWAKGDTSSSITLPETKSLVVPKSEVVMSEHDWKEWVSGIDSERCPVDEDEASDEYVRKLRDDLLQWGMSSDAIQEVGELFGWSGLEALWDAR